MAPLPSRAAGGVQEVEPERITTSISGELEPTIQYLRLVSAKLINLALALGEFDAICREHRG
jgi:hypothetical protein